MTDTHEHEKITCEICGALTHSIEVHLKKEHPEMSLDEYQKRFPGKPILSDFAMKVIQEHQRAKIAEAKEAGKPLFHEVFGLGTHDEAFSTNGHKPIPITEPTTA